MTDTFAPLKNVFRSAMSGVLVLGVLFGPFIMVSVSRFWMGN